MLRDWGCFAKARELDENRIRELDVLCVSRSLPPSVPTGRAQKPRSASISSWRQTNFEAALWWRNRQRPSDGVRSLPESWQAALEKNKSMREAFHQSETYKQFLALYNNFCTHVILPLLETEKAYVQHPPTLRFHLAGQHQAQGKIGMHQDSDYANHCCAEINFWVPMTDVHGNNSLFVESAPDRADIDMLQCFRVEHVDARPNS